MGVFPSAGVGKESRSQIQQQKLVEGEKFKIIYDIYGLKIVNIERSRSVNSISAKNLNFFIPLIKEVREFLRGERLYKSFLERR